MSPATVDPAEAIQTPDERIRMIQFIRHTLDEEGLADLPIVAGVGGNSTRETISLAKSAAAAGA
jgi:4-hydroxy-2-oxoglutarate aldolase